MSGDHAKLLTAAVRQLDTPANRKEGRRMRRADADKRYRWLLYWQVPGAVRLLLSRAGYNNAQVDAVLAQAVEPLR